MEKNMGFKIRKIREIRGFSQDYMAKKLAISQRAYSKLENQQTQLTWERIHTIAGILQVDRLDLISFDVAEILEKQTTLNGNLSRPTVLQKHLNSHEKRILMLEKELLFLKRHFGKNQ